MNPFLEDLLYFRWSKLTPDQIVEAMDTALKNAEENLDQLVSQDRGKLTFESTLLAFENATEELGRAWGLVQHLDAVCNSDELRVAHNAVLPKVSLFFARLPLNETLYDLLKTYSQTDEAKALSGVRKRFLDETLQDFRQQGADLPAESKQRLEALEQELAEATQKFSENVLDSTNAWERLFHEPAVLRGLPQGALDNALADAKAKGYGLEGDPIWRFTLKMPSFLPVMEHVESEEIRKEFWQANATVGLKEPWENTALVWKILRLRHEKARLLDRKNFADLVLERRMAKSGAKALSFVEELHGKIKKVFDKETVTLQEYKAEVTGQQAEPLHPWEVAYWTEHQRKALYDFDQEELRPYFPLDKVINGMFRLCERLFGIEIKEREAVYLKPGSDGAVATSPNERGAVEVWHPEVKFYELFHENGVLLGSFYADWHPRDAKRGGAWMNYLRGGCPPRGHEDRRLHIGLICGNMTPPSDGKPALLTHDEVQTVFHEFGHLLHQLLGNVEIRSLNGVSVPWDFVELPSQIMENFCWERESLDFFARHWETGEVIPPKLFKKMMAARNYMAATMNMRQLSFGKLDLELHINHSEGDDEEDLDTLSRKTLAAYLAPVSMPTPSMARRFTHLFGSPVGYGAAYYSYKWAEVLDADAFSKFQAEGVLEPRIGREFRDKILARGNEDDPANLFRSFMGRDPDPEAFLRRDGLVV